MSTFKQTSVSGSRESRRRGEHVVHHVGRMRVALALNQWHLFSSKQTDKAGILGDSRRTDYINGCSLWGLLLTSLSLHVLIKTVAPSQPVS
jgi:hypothetical protein